MAAVIDVAESAVDDKAVVSPEPAVQKPGEVADVVIGGEQAGVDSFGRHVLAEEQLSAIHLQVGERPRCHLAVSPLQCSSPCLRRCPRVISRSPADSLLRSAVTLPRSAVLNAAFRSVLAEYPQCSRCVPQCSRCVPQFARSVGQMTTPSCPVIGLDGRVTKRLLRLDHRSGPLDRGWRR